MINKAKFEERLLALEREVRDLKTAHQRGLATIEFPVVRTLPPSSSSRPWILMTTGSNRRLFPFMLQMAVSDISMSPLSNEPVVFDEENNQIIWRFYATDTTMGQKCEVKLVATDSVKAETYLDSGGVGE